MIKCLNLKKSLLCEGYRLLEFRHCLGLMYSIIFFKCLGITVEPILAVEKLSDVTGILFQEAWEAFHVTNQQIWAQQLSFCELVHMVTLMLKDGRDLAEKRCVDNPMKRYETSQFHHS